jgi:hypothetical protein
MLTPNAKRQVGGARRRLPLEDVSDVSDGEEEEGEIRRI